MAAATEAQTLAKSATQHLQQAALSTQVHNDVTKIQRKIAQAQAKSKDALKSCNNLLAQAQAQNTTLNTGLTQLYDSVLKSTNAGGEGSGPSPITEDDDKLLTALLRTAEQAQQDLGDHLSQVSSHKISAHSALKDLERLRKSLTELQSGSGVPLPADVLDTLNLELQTVTSALGEAKKAQAAADQAVQTVKEIQHSVASWHKELRRYAEKEPAVPQSTGRGGGGSLSQDDRARLSQRHQAFLLRYASLSSSAQNNREAVGGRGIDKTWAVLVLGCAKRARNFEDLNAGHTEGDHQVAVYNGAGEREIKVCNLCPLLQEKLPLSVSSFYRRWLSP